MFLYTRSFASLSNIGQLGGAVGWHGRPRWACLRGVIMVRSVLTHSMPGCNVQSFSSNHKCAVLLDGLPIACCGGVVKHLLMLTGGVLMSAPNMQCA